MTDGDVSGLLELMDLAWFYFSQPFDFAGFSVSWFGIALGILSITLPVYIVRKIASM